jgi:small membrane protein
MLIQLILIGLAVICGVYFLSHAQTYSVRAWKKIFMVLFVIFMIISIIHPGLTTSIAQKVGIGRGADLILYLLAIGFVFESISIHFKLQQQRTLTNKLARKIAILEAKTVESDHNNAA